MNCARVENDKKGYCVGVKDDLNSIVDKIFLADALILSCPVYIGDVTAQMKAFMDRLECISATPKRRWLMATLRNKVGGAVVNGTLRHGGQEHTWASIFRFFVMHEMIPVGSVEVIILQVLGAEWVLAIHMDGQSHQVMH